MILLIISFFAGVLTVLAPCVLPVLPVIIGGSVGSSARDRSRPYIIAAALAISIVAFTLVLKTSTLLINLSPAVLTDISGGILILLGLASTAPELWEHLVIYFNWQADSQRWLGAGERNRSKYVGPILVGMALGPVFASCSPTYAFILASILPRSFLAGFIYLVAYSLGLVLTLLGISLIGRAYIKNLQWVVDTHSWFRRGIGVIFILIGIVVISGNLVPVETWVANHLPFDETKIEQTLLATEHSSVAGHTITNSSALNTSPTPAPDFQGLTSWINSQPLSLEQLRGKVVLVDFWTYSCINCIRTLPYLEKWYATYAKDGFTIVGVNTPEFAFEHNPSNVQTAVEHDGIKYPVALDNDYATWNAYQNNSWPADYLIDQSGNIRYVAFGEGDYDKTESAIQALLGIQQSLQTPNYTVPITESQTPETYFGNARRSGFAGTVSAKANQDGSYTYTPAQNGQLYENAWTLSGNWQASDQSITSAGSDTTLKFNFNAKDVYVVASGNGQSVGVKLSSGSTQDLGSDVQNGMLTVAGSRLFHIVSLPQTENDTVTLTVPAGVSLYTFTFGS